MRISTVSWIHIFIMVVAGSFIISATIFSLSNSHDIKKIWVELENSSSEKERALSAIRSQLGFGGMIHNFKNLVLRGENGKTSKVVSDIGGVKASLTRYKTLNLNKEEYKAIEDIETVVNAYRRSLDRIEKLHTSGLYPRQIDQRIKVDDRPAINALLLLDRLDHINPPVTAYSEIIVTKTYLTLQLKKEIGYSGMIHNYKNYILRQDNNHLRQTKRNLFSAFDVLDEYQTYNNSAIEKDAVLNIRKVLNEYNSNLSRIQKLIQKQTTPKDIDATVKIDDAPMLNGMILLDQEIEDQRRVKKQSLLNALNSIILSSKSIAYTTTALVILIIGISIWFIRFRLIKPVKSLTTVMHRLAKDDTDILIPENIYSDEIHEVAESVKVFRDNVIRRDKAEQELRYMNNELESLVLERTKEVKLNEQKLSALVDSAADAIITIDDKGIIQSFNLAATKMFDYSTEEIIGQNVNRLMPEPYHSKHQDYLERYQQTGQARIMGIGREVTALRKNGDTIPIDLSISEIQYENTIIYTGIIHDLTERNRNEEQLRHSQKMDALGKLTGGIAHDYNNMLSVILGFSELLLDKSNSDPKTREYVLEIQHAAERGTKLTSKLLSFSRKKSNKATNCNINHIIQENRHMLEKTLTPRINLILDLADNTPNVNLDPGDFEDALLNLTINAMHAMADGGDLILTTKVIDIDPIEANHRKIRHGQYVKLSVRDTGIGMDKDIQENIFDPFFTTKGEKGTGLGLSQVYGLVKRSEGEIELYSEPGQGSNFVLYFPVSDEHQETIKSSTDSHGELRGNETILVVDDEISITKMTSEILKAAGYTVHCADSGEQALDVLKTEAIDLLLSDILMPDMDGFQLAAQVQKLYPNIKVQLVSGYNDTLHANLVDKIISNEILQKPVHKETLLLRLRDILTVKQQV